MIITKLIEFKPQIHECCTWWSCLSLTVTNSLSEVLSVEWPPKINKNLSSFENLSDPLQDAGYYHCQLATHPPQLVWSRLELVRPVFKMSSSDLHYHRCVHCTLFCTVHTVHLHYHRGSQIRLRCEAGLLLTTSNCDNTWCWSFSSIYKACAGCSRRCLAN